MGILNYIFNAFSLRTILLSLVITSFSFISISASNYAIISDLGTSARSIAIGNVEGFSSVANSTFENPASLFDTRHYSVSLFSAKTIEDTRFLSTSISGKIPFGTLAFGFTSASVSDIPETDKIGNQHVIKDTFDYSNSIYKLSFQSSLNDSLHVGVSYSYFSQNFFSVSGSGFDLDLGLFWEHKNFDLSFTAKNILPGSKVSYSNGASEELPFQATIGLNTSLQSFQLLPQLKFSHGQGLLSLGTVYTPSFVPFIEVLAGYRQHLDYSQQRHSNLTFGIGVTLFDFNFNYAYERSDYILGDHKSYFSLDYSF